MCTSPAPSAAPDSVSVSSVAFSSITVQWEMVPCIHRNGDITGYSVQYTGGGSTQTMSADTLMVTIRELMSSTEYSIQVAAVNSAGTGVYSTADIQQTSGGYHLCTASIQLSQEHIKDMTTRSLTPLTSTHRCVVSVI